MADRNVRNVRLMIGERVFEVRIHNPYELREDFIQRIGRILRSMGGAFNAERRRNIRIVIGERGERGDIDNIDFDIGISNRDEPREDFIQRIVEDLSIYQPFGSNDVVGPIISIAGPGINAAGPGINAAGPGINAAGPGINAAGPGINAAGRDVFDCPICFNQYSNDIRPTTLPCGHSLCMIDAAQIHICPLCQVPFVFANQRMSVSLRDASLACVPGPHGGRRKYSRKTKRRRKRSRRRR
jgi:hypothetical protein